MAKDISSKKIVEQSMKISTELYQLQMTANSFVKKPSDKKLKEMIRKANKFLNKPAPDTLTFALGVSTLLTEYRALKDKYTVKREGSELHSPETRKAFTTRPGLIEMKGAFTAMAEKADKFLIDWRKASRKKGSYQATASTLRRSFGLVTKAFGDTAPDGVKKSLYKKFKTAEAAILKQPVPSDSERVYSNESRYAAFGVKSFSQVLARRADFTLKWR